MRRRANLLSFPQEKPDLGVETAAERTVVFVPQTPLEITVLLGGSSVVAPEGQVLMEVERRSPVARSLDEELEREDRQEAAARGRYRWPTFARHR